MLAQPCYGSSMLSQTFDKIKRYNGNTRYTPKEYPNLESIPEKMRCCTRDYIHKKFTEQKRMFGLQMSWLLPISGPIKITNQHRTDMSIFPKQVELNFFWEVTNVSNRPLHACMNGKQGNQVYPLIAAPIKPN